MKLHKSFLRLTAILAALPFAACAGVDPEVTDEDEGAFSSAEQQLVDLDFDGELVSAQPSSPNSQIRAQLLFTVGHLNANSGVSQLPKLSLSNVTTSAIGGGLHRIAYHAKLPVAWGSRASIPRSYRLTLPRRLDGSSDDRFVATYKDRCADEPESATANNFWYHYRPEANGCSLAADDVVRVEATVARSASNTTGKYPDYQRIWEDGVLRVVAIFGKYDDGATASSDAGIAAYNDFVASLRSALPGATMTPAIGGAPGAAVPEVTLSLARSSGQRVEATVMLVDKLSSEGAAFDRRYAELSSAADIILYNGHAGLGANVQALADKGQFVPGKYQIFLFNGCDTFAYIDDSLARTRARLNPDDPKGTRYMDVLTNAMPAFFVSMSDASMTLVQALLATNSPKTYESIFRGVDRAQRIVVTGEEDNAFTPSLAVLPSWGFSQEGAVRKGETVTYQTDVLAAGTYVFTLMPDPAIAGGDADLRVRVGAPPTITPDFKCPSYVANSNERCVVTLTTPSRVHVAVTGDSSRMASPFELRAFRR